MSKFASSVEAFITAIQNQKGWIDELNALSQEISRHLKTASRQEIADSLHRYAELIPKCPLVAVGLMALNCGSLVEKGGDPALAGSVLLAKLPSILDLATEFCRLARARAEADPDLLADLRREAEDPSDVSVLDVTDEELGQRYGPVIYKEKPAAVLGHMAKEVFSLGVIAHLSRSKTLRDEARANPSLLAKALAGDEITDDRSFLALMLRVLDDERLLVLHPEQGKGYDVRVGGIADNFQLHTLLAASLIGKPADGWLKGEPPSPAVVAAARDSQSIPPGLYATGAFNLWNWTGLGADRKLPEGQANEATAHWIWNEGCPADILAFDGIRTVLLGPPPFPRSWSPGRPFSALVPEVSVVKMLPPPEVRDWINRLAAAPRG